MIKRMTVAMAALGALLLIGTPRVQAQMDPAPVNLLDALGSGDIDATFYGNGDESVKGRIRRSAFGPEKIVVEPGTQFWAQREGLQGMTTLGWVPVDLTRSNIAYVVIPTACTNYNLAAPTPLDRMNPVCCPEPRMAALAEQVGRAHPPQEVAQIAVWAIANNPQWNEIAGLVEAKVQADSPEERTEAAEAYRVQAVQLLRAAGVNPTRFRMFR